MKLPDALWRNQDGDPLDERIAAEMDALDSALRGEQVDPEMSSIATLASDLRADREEIDTDFSARLDAWAAAGFPRGERPGASPSQTASSGAGAGGVFDRLRLRFSATPPRRLIGPAFAAASVAVIAAVAISQSGEISGSNSNRSSGDVSQPLAIQDATTSTSATTDGAAGTQGSGDLAEPVAPDSAASGSNGGASAGSSGDTLAPGSPELTPFDKSSAGSDNEHYLRDSRLRGAPGSTFGRSARGNDLDKVRQNRKVERAAELSLKADPKDVPDVASRAADVTERYDGNVLSSEVTGSPESAQATLELAIPSKNLDAAMSDLADLAEVSSRTESSNDITRSFVTARDQLSGLRAERDSLLTRLAAATTDEETADLKAKLSLVNDQIAQARGSVDKLGNRASISRVGLDISSDGMIGDSGGDDSDNGWSIGDALHDAGHVLTVAGGVALISGAVLLPLALIVLIAALLIRASRTRARERALDE